MKKSANESFPYSRLFRLEAAMGEFGVLFTRGNDWQADKIPYDIQVRAPVDGEFKVFIGLMVEKTSRLYTVEPCQIKSYSNNADPENSYLVTVDGREISFGKIRREQQNNRTPEQYRKAILECKSLMRSAQSDIAEIQAEKSMEEARKLKELEQVLKIQERQGALKEKLDRELEELESLEAMNNYISPFS